MDELPEEMLRRFQTMEQSVSAERGPFVLFGVFLRENSPGRWDLVVSAPWVEHRHPNALTLLDRFVRHEFPDQEQLLLSQIAFVSPRGPQNEAAMRRIGQAVRAATGKPEMEHGLVEMRDVDLFGQTIDHAYILTAQPLNVPVPA